MLERPAAKELTEKQRKWLARADKRPIKRRELRVGGSKKPVYFLTRCRLLQLVPGPRGPAGDMWYITDEGRALRETPRHPAARIAWSIFSKDVRSFRVALGMGLRELSRDSGIPSPTLSRLERARPVDAETFTYFSKWIGRDPREYLI